MHQALQTARVVWFGMFFSMLAFLGIVHFFVIPTGTATPMPAPMPSVPTPPPAFSSELAFMIWIGVAVSGAIAFGVIQRVIVSNLRKEWQQLPADSDPVNLTPRWFTVWLCGSAIVEGVGMLATILYLITEDTMLAGGALTAILIIATRYPGATSLRSFSDSITLSTSGPADPHPR